MFQLSLLKIKVCHEHFMVSNSIQLLFSNLITLQKSISSLENFSERNMYHYSIYEILHAILMIVFDSNEDEACSWEHTCTNTCLVWLWSESFQSCIRTGAQEEGKLCCLSIGCNDKKTSLKVVLTSPFPTLNLEWYYFHNTWRDFRFPPWYE
jgi:hypothetical protein